MSPFGDMRIANVVLALVAFSVLLAVLGTWPVCLFLLRAYRRRIVRGMRTRAGPGTPPASPQLPPTGSSTSIAIRPTDGAGSQPILELAQRRARRFRLLFCGAGIAYAVAATAAFHLATRKEWEPVAAVAYCVLFGWPLVPTVLALSLVRRSVGWLAYAVHLAVVLALFHLAGIHLTEVVAVLVVPALFMLALGARPLRGAAWLVAPGLTVLGLTIAAFYLPVVYLVSGAPFDAYAWSFLAAGVGLLVLLAAYAWTLAHAYAAKWASDQTLLILQWWLLATIWWSILLGTQGGVGALLGLAPYGVLVLILVVAGLAGRPAVNPPVRLLLLRTFGSRQRSSRLLYDLTRQWRWVGSVELITGSDLASEILEPDEFLDFVLGRTARRFVRDSNSLPGRLTELDLRSDRDGRYRVNELLCHEDTWRPTVEALLGDVDAVLVDLRGLSMNHVGVVYELELLVALVPLRRVAALVDASTDQQALRWALDRAAGLAPPSSPIARDPTPELQVVELRVGGSAASRRLMSALAQVAAPDRAAGLQV